MATKLQILKQWLLGPKKYSISFGELLRILSIKSFVPRVNAKIKSIKNEGKFKIFRLEGLDHPLYFPAKYDVAQMRQVISEILFPEHWHCYEVEPVKVKRGDVVLDCGAGEGLFALSVANRCNEVYAIEPLYEFIESMKMTFKDVSNVKLVRAALSDIPGSGIIGDDGIRSKISNGKGRNRVEIATIDQLFYERGINVDFIKADLEGYDFKALRGAEATIRENLPTIAITVYHQFEHAELISRLLKDISSSYNIRTRGITEKGTPVMLHAWVE